MRKAACTVLAAVWLAGAAGAARAQGFDYQGWDRVLKRFVTEPGRVDYAALKADSGEFDRYVAQIAARSPASHPQDFPNPASQLAYWINAYNALVIKGVIEAWPVKSVLKIGLLPHSFFWGKTFIAGGQKITLDAIEHDMIRKQFADPRVHFALVCASNSCPSIRREAYTPENVDRQLDDAARAFINDPRGMKIDAASNRVTLSRIFKWYGGDFESYVRAKGLSGTGEPVLDYIRLYADPASRRALDALERPRVEFFKYDWGINDVHAPTATK